MATTIQISKNLSSILSVMKMHRRESYESIIWDLIEDRMEFSEQTKRDIAKSEKEIREGKTVSLEEIKKKLKI